MLTPFCLCACSDIEVEDVFNMSKDKQTIKQNVQLSVGQAKAYANLFSNGFNTAEMSEESNARYRGTSSNVTRTIHDVNFLVEDDDTLMYAVNYNDNMGFVIISGANNSFPIIAHSSTGNVNLNDITHKNPLSLTLMAYKEKAKKALNDTTAIHSVYYDEWKDLGKEGYEYEIELTNGEPVSKSSETLARRRDSSGKKSIYPYTGKDLDNWCQEGGYNYYAQNQYPIGCPAVAIGMLMYDTSERMLGNSQPTYPSFSYFDRTDLRNVSYGTDLAKKLRQIADNIPGYEFDKNGSGATPEQVLEGLHNLGYTKAQLVQYDFEKLYQSMQFKGMNYFGEETTFNRGVLICAYQGASYGWLFGGHIWFCDGYYEQSYTVKKKFLGIKVKSWTEYDDRLYMNWGWGADSGNGWYSATDNGVWSSNETGMSINQKFEPKMYINLSYYEYPKNAR